MFVRLAVIMLFVTLATPSRAQDQKAIAIADRVMEAMGGQDNWNNTRYLQWQFFGSRMWWWDKWTGNVRVESLRDDLRIAMNIHDKTGRVFVHGVEQTVQDSLDKFLERGYRMWINDSYWLVMPFKLRDPGTNLSLLDEQKTLEGQTAQVLELTFNDVGVTPQNKYWIYIDPASNQVVQWDYFSSYDDPEPRFQSTWSNYEQHGDIWLSSGRGDRELQHIAVHESLPMFLFVNVLKTAEELLANQ